ncbi:GNAT family N-acetyltransferase [Hydrogenivirga sp. 128-5-R1-1]|uniref:GNAT family N-acetyltransferase n=1 Tax=Hydrogenivirga sp. 128-5-R1-1 TaxID=392423 RepID=UPI00015EF867|nr:GNAT family N-acetyltransferase [Hydrogenivirga sp. 128-5-R1-1]EDP75578.1 hypothetical protein HG1285_16480 [Hydrogenivirga sp. 128-5-R1-1]
MLEGRYIKFEYVKEDDAEFILNLRTNAKLSRFISKTEKDIKKQIEWIKEYKQREKEGKEHYFIIKNKSSGEKEGTVRVYNMRNDICEWGSWILKSNNPLIAIDSIILIYKFIFSQLEFEKVTFDVIKENKEVIMFHKSYGAEKIGEDQKSIYFLFKKNKFINLEKKYGRLLND